MTEAPRNGGAGFAGAGVGRYQERPAEGSPAGLLVLHHGRGADDFDLVPLGDALDPRRRLHVVTPRAPLELPGMPGHHWYVVPRVGFPDPETFFAAQLELAAFHDELWARTGIGPERTVLGGFSMGAVMSYATGLDGGRPRPAGILAFSGFVPNVEGWTPDLESRQGLPAFIAHGRSDPVIVVEFGHQARDLLEQGGLAVEYREHVGGHAIHPDHVHDAQRWLPLPV